MGVSWSCSDRSHILPRAGCGAFRAGCVDLMLNDDLDGDSGIFMRIYYPVDQDNTESQPLDGDHPLWLSRKEYLEGLASYLKQSSRRLQFFFDWIVGEKRSPALWLRPLAGSIHSSFVPSSSSMPDFIRSPSYLPSSKSFHSLSSPLFPVIIFSHGLSGCRHFYSTYCSSLASYGFVVAAIEHRDYSACWTYKLIPDPLTGRLKEKNMAIRLSDNEEKESKIRNQQLCKRVSESVKALHVLEEIHLGQLNTQHILVGQDFNWSQFKGRLNLSRASVIGHSFGGATAIAATAFSTDFQAAVVLDGWLCPLEADHYERAVQPTLFINAGRWQWSDNIKKMRRLNQDNALRLMYTLCDGVHQTFTDFPFLVGSFFGRRFNLQGETEAETSMEAIVEISVMFLRRVHENNTVESAIDQLIEQKYAKFIVEGSNCDLIVED